VTDTTSAPFVSISQGIATEVSSPPEYASTTLGFATARFTERSARGTEIYTV